MKMISVDTNNEIQTIDIKDFNEIVFIFKGWPKILQIKKLAEPYAIVVDEAFKLKEKDFNGIGTFLIDENTQEHMKGKIIIAKFDNGKMIGMENEDTKALIDYLKNIRAAYSTSISKGYNSYKEEVIPC